MPKSQIRKLRLRGVKPPADGHTDLNPGPPGPWQDCPGPCWAAFICWGRGGQETGPPACTPSDHGGGLWGGGCAGGPQGAEHLQLGPGPQHDSLSGTWGEMEASVWNSARCEKGHGEGEKLGLGKVSTKRTETALLLPLQVSAPCSCLRPPDIHLSGVDLHDSGPGLLVGHRELDLAVQAA